MCSKAMEDEDNVDDWGVLPMPRDDYGGNEEVWWICPDCLSELGDALRYARNKKNENP